MRKLSQAELRLRARALRLLLLDIDGVMTDGSLLFIEGQEELKRFHVHDGMGIIMARKAGLKVGFLTGRPSGFIRRRAEELKVDDVLESAFEKEEALDILLDKYKLQASSVAYIGDDINDIPVMRRVGLPIAVRNARLEVKKHSVYVTKNPGGEGAVREAVEKILALRGQKDSIIDCFSMTNDEKMLAGWAKEDVLMLLFGKGATRRLKLYPRASSIIATDPEAVVIKNVVVEPLSRYEQPMDSGQALQMLKALNKLVDLSGELHHRKVVFR